MFKLAAAVLLAGVALALVAPAAADPRPTVMWHGMGDTCCSIFSMGRIKRQIEKEVPGIYVHSIEIGNNTNEDQMAGFIGNINDQLDGVCKRLKADPKLAGGFNAIGFSQGGQFLRAYVERCNDPPVHNLITMGGQHMGVSEIPHCELVNSTLCEFMAEALGMGAYTAIQDFLIQAQYFRSSYELKEYLAKNIFLPDINCEVNSTSDKCAQYKKNLVSLNNFVMVKFTKDTMVIPRESEQFGAYAEGGMSTIIPMRESPIYTNDWIGLRQLDNAGKLIEKDCPGDHLQFTDEYFSKEIIPYLSS